MATSDKTKKLQLLGGFAKKHELEQKLDADKLPEAVNDALAQAKESGEFDGEPGQPGEPGADYVLTDDYKTEIAEIAAGMIDTALLSIIGEVE